MMLLYILIPFFIPLTLLIRRLFHLLSPTELVKGIPRPPLVSNWIPFVGSALSLAGGDGVWGRLEKKYGPVFRLQAMGEVKVFVTTPALINFLFKNSKSYDFSYYRKYIQSSVFGMGMKESFADIMADQIFPDHHRFMQPGSIAVTIERYAEYLEAELASRHSDLVRAEGIPLSETVFDIIFNTANKAFFSPSFPSSASKLNFLAFDKTFPLLNLNKLPHVIRNRLLAPREELLDLIGAWWYSVSEEDRRLVAMPPLSMAEHGEAEGWSNRAIACMFLGEMWALGANAPNAALWCLFELVRHSSTLSACRSEIVSSISSLSPPTLSSLMHRPQPELITLLPLLNASLQETLRLYTSSFAIRLVLEDTTIPASLCTVSESESETAVAAGSVGKEMGVALKKGDEVICVTRHNQVADTGDWGTDAATWDPTRWTEYERKRGTMMPFGGGVSMCEGRHFASAEILTFLAYWIYTFDTDILPARGLSLQPDMQRIGLGALQPKGEMYVRLRERVHTAA